MDYKKITIDYLLERAKNNLQEFNRKFSDHQIFPKVMVWNDFSRLLLRKEDYYTDIDGIMYRRVNNFTYWMIVLEWKYFNKKYKFDAFFNERNLSKNAVVSKLKTSTYFTDYLYTKIFWDRNYSHVSTVRDINKNAVDFIMSSRFYISREKSYILQENKLILNLLNDNFNKELSCPGFVDFLKKYEDIWRSERLYLDVFKKVKRG